MQRGLPDFAYWRLGKEEIPRLLTVLFRSRQMNPNSIFGDGAST
jgi:hypothetical protein